MKILRVEDDEKGRANRFIIWVWARDDAIHWKDCPYAFQYEEGLIYFVVGGREANRLVGEAQSRDEAIMKATIYLEGWLRECGAID